jgi:hypothetical protein
VTRFLFPKREPFFPEWVTQGSNPASSTGESSANLTPSIRVNMPAPLKAALLRRLIGISRPTANVAGGRSDVAVFDCRDEEGGRPFEPEFPPGTELGVLTPLTVPALHRIEAGVQIYTHALPIR